MSQLPTSEVNLTFNQLLNCYVQRYDDLFVAYCHGNWTKCDWVAIAYHWERHGKQEGRKLSCTHVRQCTRANFNLLNLIDEDHTPYNMCRNLEWQVCAAKGMLPGQKGSSIQFSVAPKDMDTKGLSHSLGTCGGSHPTLPPAGSNGIFGYTNDDIYFLEVCLYNQICENNEALFAVRRGEDFRCRFSRDRFNELERILRTPATLPSRESVQCTAKGPVPLSDGTGLHDGVITCEQCAALHTQIPGECSDMRDCAHCSYCQSSWF